MSVPATLHRARSCRLLASAVCVASFAAFAPAHAGHEVPYYPSFYPQEVRIEPLDPEAAARELIKTVDPLHAYIGAAPHFDGTTPEQLKLVRSLGSLITVSVNPKSPRMQGRDARCRALAGATTALAERSDLVAHAYPITPYHADYFAHADRVLASKPVAAEAPPLTFRAEAGGRGPLLAPSVPVNATDWDLSLEEVPIDELLRAAGIGSGLWLAPPWAKEGWFQAYHLLQPTMSEAAERERAGTIYDRLTHDEFGDLAEQLKLERSLLAALMHGCERAVIGYRLRREYFNDEFSNGIENILVDSQKGFNSPVFIRVVKLKDFPWNGWLRLGVATRPAAAWNPVAGFTDAAGRLIWATVGDDAFLPIPNSSRWVANRAEVVADPTAKIRQSVRVPADALMPQPDTGKLLQTGDERVATSKLVYRVSASEFHDGTQMEVADLLYPYALAFRWGGSAAGNATFDPEIAAATQLMRERLRGVKVIRIEETKLAIADKVFSYRSPIVEVYLDNLAVEDEVSRLLAPPWSSVPWHVLALMEAAVERGIAAFSQSEAKRRGLPWLDLVRDPAQLAAMTALIKEFAKSGYRPAALEGLVGPEAAKARWQALEKFVEQQKHLLITNGAYRLTSWTPQTVVLGVVRDFTYPIGIGTFNLYAYPPRARVTDVEQAGGRIAVAVDAEMVVKEMRNHRAISVPLKRDTLRETLAIRPLARYFAVAGDGEVAAAGSAKWEADGRFVVSLPTLPPGRYTVFTAIFLDGNTINPSIARAEVRSD